MNGIAEALRDRAASRLTTLSRRRVVALLVLGAVLVWAVVQGAHSHDGLAPVARDLGAETPARTIAIDASTGQLDLRGLAVRPGEVIDFVLVGSAGAPHRFVLSGLGGAEIDERLAANGDTVIRIRAPQQGALSFFCVVPGHEGLHGSLVVDVGTERDGG
ncbi:MAG: hypothetical protein F4X76_05440 [Chloroflexi bacterium]|nr:hypothetical protein [Chloroflexota bacterium]